MYSPLVVKGLPCIMPKSKTNRTSRVNIQITPRRPTTNRRKPNQKSSRSRSSLEQNLQTSLVLSGSQISRVNTRPVALRLLGNLSSMQRKYLLALQSPFHPDAIGVRVPDFNSRASASFTIRWKSMVLVPASSTVHATMILVPNPCVFGAISNNNTLSSSTVTMVTVEGQSVLMGISATTGIPMVLVDGAGNNRPRFSNQFATFRVVAGGVRIANLAPLTNNQFVMNTYQVPCSRSNTIPYRQIVGFDTNAWTGSPTLTQVSDMFTGSLFTNDTTSTLNLQSRRAYTGYEIQDSPLTLSFQPNNPTAHIFRSSDGLPFELGSTVAKYGDEVIVDAGGVMVAETNDSSLLSNTGWDGIVTNFWQSTNGITLELEYVLHCEGIQIFQTDSDCNGYGNSQRDSLNPMFSMDALIGMARQAADYARTIPRVMNGMADLMRASGFDSRRYNTSRLNRLTYQTGEF